MILNCRNCQTTVNSKRTLGTSYNVGEVLQETGWSVVVCNHKSEYIWLCKVCAQVASQHAKALYIMTGSHNLGFSQLITVSEDK